MKQTFLLLLLFVLGLMPAKADNITVNGTSRSYNVYAPQNLGENRPLLIFCHGYNQDANWMQNSEFKNDQVSMEAVCDTAKFVVVFPNGIDKSWDTSGDRDINFIKAIIDKMVTQHNIDRNRVYLGGFSMGGMLTYHAMNKIPDLIAAFAPCSGYPMGGATANANVRAIPILHIHGTADDTVPAMRPALSVVHSQHSTCGLIIMAVQPQPRSPIIIMVSVAVRCMSGVLATMVPRFACWNYPTKAIGSARRSRYILVRKSGTSVSVFR